MLSVLREAASGLAHLFFPHVCTGCGNHLHLTDQWLCTHCTALLPYTDFPFHAGNPVEKVFWGRLPVSAAATLFYFYKDSLVQHLMHQLKYKGHQEVGRHLGVLMGRQLSNAQRFQSIHAIIPLPLSPAKQRQRGYNQAECIARGIGEAMQLPLITNAVVRTKATDSQTHKSRTDRWGNMQNIFRVIRPQDLAGKSILLVDDIITTGATLESCGRILLGANIQSLNIAAIAYTV